MIQLKTFENSYKISTKRIYMIHQYKTVDN